VSAQVVAKGTIGMTEVVEVCPSAVDIGGQLPDVVLKPPTQPICDETSHDDDDAPSEELLGGVRTIPGRGPKYRRRRELVVHGTTLATKRCDRGRQGRTHGTLGQRGVGFPRLAEIAWEHPLRASTDIYMERPEPLVQRDTLSATERGGGWEEGLETVDC